VKKKIFTEKLDFPIGNSCTALGLLTANRWPDRGT
jgi:hypothetical protein